MSGTKQSSGDLATQARELSFKEAVAALGSPAVDSLVIFAGAGISVGPPASCPTWFKLVEDAFQSGAITHHKISPLSDSAILRWNALKDKNKIKVELICQILHANLGSNLIDALNTLVSGAPNTNHFALAKLMASGRAPAIITTNFDPYIEEALLGCNAEFDVYVGKPPRKLSKALGPNKGQEKPLIVKPHGSIAEAHSLIVTMRQTGRPATRELRDLIAVTLQHHTVLLVGYSGNDDDICPALLSAAPHAKKVFWAMWERKDFTPNISAFVDRCPTCSLIWCEKESILQSLVPEAEALVKRAPAHSYSSDDRLQQWASLLPEHAWTNFFCEFLLMLGPNPEEIRLVLKYSGDVVRRVVVQIPEIGRAIRI
jgi:hypothetical protein